MILVDSGFTHNFISAAVVENLSLPVQQVISFGVQIDNEDIIRCNSICMGITLQQPNLAITKISIPFQSVEQM